MTELFVYALRELEDSDMVVITISNEVNVKDRAVGISFRRKDQITGDVIWTVFEKVAQSNARFNALDRCHDRPFCRCQSAMAEASRQRVGRSRS